MQTGTIITIGAHSDYGHTGHYVARIKGRSSKFTFNREFIGFKDDRHTEAKIDDPGIYERVHVTRKGKDTSYIAILPHADGLAAVFVSVEEAMAIAKRLDAGENFTDFVILAEEEAQILKKAEAQKQRAAANTGEAEKACWAILSALPANQAKAVLRALSLRIKPPTPRPTAQEGPECVSQ